MLKVHADADQKVVRNTAPSTTGPKKAIAASVTMQKLGRIFRDEATNQQFQMYVCDSKPFRGILSTVTFDVRGLDHRVRDYRLTVVPSPVIVETKLDCVFPDYMVNEQLSLWLPRTID